MTKCWNCSLEWNASANTSITLLVEIYGEDSDRLLTSMKAVYVGVLRRIGDNAPGAGRHPVPG